MGAARSLGLFAALFLVAGARAANSSDAEVSFDTNLKSESEFKKSIDEIDGSLDKVNGLVRKKSLVVHRLRLRTTGPQYLWEDENAAAAPRQALLKYSELELKSLLRQIEILGQKKEELLGDLELFRLRDEEQQAQPLTVVVKRKPTGKVENFSCAKMFAEPQQDKLRVKDPFGIHKDKETGLSWRNPGWWISDIKEQVRACASGTVAFSGNITGRGHVLLLDHGNGVMTMYANMNNDNSSNLTKGDRVVAGAPLGTVQDKLFFEIRKQGEATDPKLSLGASMLSHFQF